jgi:hypothetical protein
MDATGQLDGRAIEKACDLSHMLFGIVGFLGFLCFLTFASSSGVGYCAVAPRLRRKLF